MSGMAIYVFVGLSGYICAWSDPVLLRIGFGLTLLTTLAYRYMYLTKEYQ